MIFLGFIYDLFQIFGISFIFHWFSEGISGNLWFFIDFPRVFLKSLIFWMIWIYFFEFSLGISWNFLEIIKKNHK